MPLYTASVVTLVTTLIVAPKSARRFLPPAAFALSALAKAVSRAFLLYIILKKSLEAFYRVFRELTIYIASTRPNAARFYSTPTPYDAPL